MSHINKGFEPKHRKRPKKTADHHIDPLTPDRNSRTSAPQPEVRNRREPPAPDTQSPSTRKSQPPAPHRARGTQSPGTPPNPAACAQVRGRRPTPAARPMTGLCGAFLAGPLLPMLVRAHDPITTIITTSNAAVLVRCLSPRPYFRRAPATHPVFGSRAPQMASPGRFCATSTRHQFSCDFGAILPGVVYPAENLCDLPGGDPPDRIYPAIFPAMPATRPLLHKVKTTTGRNERSNLNFSLDRDDPQCRV